MIMPNGHKGQNSHSFKDRKKYPRLNGADLYVVRLGSSNGGISGDSKSCCNASIDTDLVPTVDSKPLTGSLHDEILIPQPKPITTVNGFATGGENPRPSVLSSRPCYRCISYMSSVGIKRVFWTTDTGVWEGAKVRDLVDALDMLGNGDMSGNNAALENVFVTKHEVLMLRRTMAGL